MKRKNILVGFMIVFTVMLSSFSFYTWQIIYTPNILVEKPDQYFAVPKGSSFKDVQNALYEQNIVQDLVTFSFLAKLKNYDHLVKPGMYLLKSDMTNMEAINLLRSGAQTPIKLTFSQSRKIAELPGKLAQYMEFDSLDLATIMLHDTTPGHYGFKEETFIGMFVPNTYEVYWTESPKDLLDRMEREYKRFWTQERIQKAKSIGLTQEEVSTLASIVQAEVSQQEEGPTVAGLYINRLKTGVPLQADPTLVFAVDDFTIRRVLDIHKSVDSPYNTYLNEGLPPGPINMPTIASLNAVLNYEEHDYIFMCAKADFSGYHAFAETLQEHNINARKFQQALNRERIFR